MPKATHQQFMDAGYNYWVAEALEGRELSLIDVQGMLEKEILDNVFAYHGFIGWTRNIIDAVDNVRNVEAI